MNKKLIQNILYAGHCLGICSDWSEQAVNEIIDKLRDSDFVYNKEKLNELAIKYANEKWSKEWPYIPYESQGEEPDVIKDFKSGYRQALEE